MQFTPGFRFQHQMSLPSVRQPVTRIVIPDQYGIDQSYAVNAQTLHNIRSIVSAADPSTSVQQPPPLAPQMPQAAAQHSIGSLPSATSQYSSHSSVGSNISHGAAYDALPLR